jgi:hypothetical protein
LQIEKRFLPDPDLVTAVKLNVYETYIQHAEIGRNFTMNYKNELLQKLGMCYQRLENLKELNKISAIQG